MKNEHVNRKLNIERSASIQRIRRTPTFRSEFKLLEIHENYENSIKLRARTETMLASNSAETI